MRTLVDIPDEDLTLLNQVTTSQGVSRAEFVRRAIAVSLEPYKHADRHAAFGILADFPEDGLEFQDRMRSEW